MKIAIKQDASCGEIQIPTGDYMVALAAETQQFNLTGRGLDLKIPATKRRSKTNSKTTTVQFYSGGGPIWSLVVTTPKLGEWVAMIKYDR